MAQEPVVRYRLPEANREGLREPFQPVETEDEFVTKAREGMHQRPFITIGDVVSDTLLRHQLDPHVMVFDLATKRDAVGDAMRERLTNHPARLVEVRSEAATISDELIDALEAAFESREPTRILVHGEEDLAVLPALQKAPSGTVIYGMPNRGLVPVPVGPESRARAEHWLSLMKVDSA